MRTFNSALNVAPDPLTFVEKNGPYWPVEPIPNRDPHDVASLFAVRLKYAVPPGCTVEACDGPFHFCQVRALLYFLGSRLLGLLFLRSAVTARKMVPGIVLIRRPSGFLRPGLGLAHPPMRPNTPGLAVRSHSAAE